ncbi:MAG TPA: diguanylate cyclase [Kineosporiaceae bacterium]
MPSVAGPPVVALLAGVTEYHARVLVGASRALARRGVPLLLVTDAPLGSGRPPTLAVDLLHRGGARGVLVLADGAATDGARLADVLARLPAVTLGTLPAGVPRVVVDPAPGIRELVRHLVEERGVRRVVLAPARTERPDTAVRERIMRQELARRGVPVDDGSLTDRLARAPRPPARPPGQASGPGGWDHPGQDIDAVVALDDPAAFDALATLTDRGLRAPDDVLLSGFGDTQQASLSWPALTSVDPGMEEQGEQAAQTLLRLVDGEPAADVVVPSRLVVRASTTVDVAAVLASGDADRFAALPGVRLVEGRPMTGLPHLLGALGGLARTARALQSRVALQVDTLHLSWTTSGTSTLAQLVETLGPALSRLRVPRCFVAVRMPTGGGAEQSCRLVFSYRQGRAEPVPAEVFPRHDLLPAALRPELGHGVLLLQSLSASGRERGHLLVEPPPDAPLLTEALRSDLTRTLDRLLDTQEAVGRAAVLERLLAAQHLERAGDPRGLARDGLTGIASRTALLQRLAKEPAAGIVEGALLLVDLDLFQAFNDRYGPPAGDAALRTVASCLRRAVRDPDDLVWGDGGDTFAALLPGAGAGEALAIARRFQALLAEASIPHEESWVAPALTASVGVAVTDATPPTAAADLLAAAGRALHRAKLAGRGRVVLAGSPGARRQLGAGTRIWPPSQDRQRSDTGLPRSDIASSPGRPG